MRRSLTVILFTALFAAAGCGSDSPTAVETPPTPTSIQYITLAEYDAYLGELQRAFVDVNVMINEFGAISSDLGVGYVSDYWLIKFTENLILRVDMMQAQAERIRPAQPDLRQLHLEEYEAALADFRKAYELFQSGLAFPGSVSVDEINDAIVAGNTHIIRLQILLGDLGGRHIDFFETLPQGGDSFGNENAGF